MVALLRTRPARILAAGAALVLVAAAATAFHYATRDHKVDPALLADEPKSIVAGFGSRSYAPGTEASLVVWATPVRRVTIQIFRSGPEKIRTHRDDLMLGVPVDARESLLWHGGSRHHLTVRIGNWPSGMYFARVSGPNGWLGFAPFIVRPSHLGEHHVLVVLPTNTWEAYNFRDIDGDADGDTWYADPSIHVVNLERPYLHRGVPPHFSAYDLGYIRWLAQTRKPVDFISDDDLEHVGSAAELRRDYRLIIFSGHEEYVTPHVFATITRYRNLGGNLAFLSADDFFYRVTLEGQNMHGRTRYRDIGQPEAALLGAQYVNWNQNKYGNKHYVAVGVGRAPWFFRGTGLRDGEEFGGKYGIEINARTPDSPPGVQVLANIPNVFGPGVTAEMTYYVAKGGARVFDAGTMNFGGTAQFPVVSTMMQNLWDHLAR